MPIPSQIIVPEVTSARPARTSTTNTTAGPPVLDLDPSQVAAKARRRPRRSWKQTALAHIRRIGVLGFTFCLNRTTRRAFGLLNRRFGWVASVFVMYPATERYANQLAYAPTISRNKWRPFPVMVFRQSGRWCLVCAISSYEDEVRRGAEEHLPVALERARSIQRELHAEYLTFSGIIPGLLDKHGIGHDGNEAETTVRIVEDALHQVIERVGYDPETPVILIGARGYIGERLEARLEGRAVYAVDTKSGAASLPDSLRGENAILVNVASRRALAGYLPDAWEGLVLLNEVYPEPSHSERKALKSKGIPAFHVVGVKATAIPSFPGAYRGGAPCCAAIPTPKIDALIREL